MKVATKDLFLIYLGRTGAGPKMTLDFTKYIIDNKSFSSFDLLISDKNLLRDNILQIKSDTESVGTPTNGVGVLLKLPSFLIDTFKTLIKARKYGHKDFLFMMTHVWNPMVMILIKLMIRNSNILYVVHDGEIHLGEKNFALQAVLSQTEMFLSDKFITLTEKVKTKVQNKFPEKQVCILSLPMFDFGARLEPKKISNQPTFLFFGRIIKYKGLELFVDAVKVFDSKYGKDYKVIIAGEGEMEQDTLIKIEQINTLERKVIVANRYIKEEEIEEIWNGVDVCVLPYIEANSQSGVVSIAINKGLPCIITPLSGIIEQCCADDVANSFSLVSRDLSPEAFSDQMLEICQEDKYFLLSKNSINFQKKVGWGRWVDAINKI